MEQPLHRRVDRGFLDYASYVIRDRAIHHGSVDVALRTGEDHFHTS